MSHDSLSTEASVAPALDLRRSLTAGWLSLIVHLTLLIAGVLLLRVSPRMTLEEGERPVSIVLASVPSSSAETNYFADPTASELDASAAAPTAKSSPLGESGGLPDSSSQPQPTTDIALPGAFAPVIGGIGLPVANTSGGTSGTAVIDSTAGMEEILAEEAKRPRTKGPEGPQGEMSVFGTATTRGHSFVFLIDRSQSMGAQGLGAIAAAEVELLAALEKLESNHQFQIVAYNQSPTYFHDRKLIAVSDDSLRSGRDFLSNLAAFGATDHERAIVSALQLKPDVIYVLTDGDPVLTASQRKRIRSETGGRTTISCIQFGRIQPDEDTRTALEALARDNRGTYVFIDMSKRR